MIEILSLFARAGGGGSGGGGGGAGIILLPLIVAGAVTSWWIRRQKILKAEANQKIAQSTDPSWSDEVIEERASEVFYAFQKDWSEFNTKNMKSYLTPRYYDHIVIMLAALWQMKRRNEMSQVQLKSATLFGLHDDSDNELDRFTVEIKATAMDNLIDEASEDILHSSSSAFEELWHFEREGEKWMLDAITQVNKDGLVVKYDSAVDEKYLNFAQQNDFFYNADFGWLLLPLQGILFSESSYGRSDVNHHVIGLYHNVVVQFFEYIPIIEGKAKFKDHFSHFYRSRNPLAEYTIAHTKLPKDYSNILVERRRTPTFFSFTPRNMTKITLEWPKFNKLFNVFATNIDKVASLELLHPAFMEDLASLPFDVNIEIVNDDLYLYTTDSEADYQQMLDILKEAFEEMKM